jgi:hypothetical protein
MKTIFDRLFCWVMGHNWMENYPTGTKVCAYCGREESV